jgi:zinc-finger of transposase IS204/IS1001/IS1096/IS1165
MTDSRTVLPAPKLLNLTSVRAEESAITLCAQTSSSAAQCPTCGKRSARVHSRYMRTLADLPWQGVPVSAFTCASEGSSARRFHARGRSSRNVCPVSLHPTLAGPSASRAGSRTSPSPSEEKRVLASSKISGSWFQETPCCTISARCSSGTTKRPGC